MNSSSLSVVSAVLASPLLRWLIRLGGPGLILLGLADNSAIPLPGSMDLLLIILCSHQKHLWPYYAVMATAGGVIGGYLTYRLAEKGGEETLEKKIGKQRAEKVYRRFKKHGFSSVVVGSMLPPPFPIVPFLLAPGALQYPRRNFLAALTLGRSIRYFGIAFLAQLYGSRILGALRPYYAPLLYILIALGVAGGVAALVYFKWYRPRRQREERKRGEPVETFPVPGRANQQLAHPKQRAS